MRVDGRFSEKRPRRASCRLTDYLPEYSGLTPQDIILVVDGLRDYDPKLEQAAWQRFFGTMRERFLSNARNKGYQTVDLQPYFTAHFREHGRHFEFPTDWHWNSLGHAVAARAVLDSTVLSKLIAPP